MTENSYYVSLHTGASFYAKEYEIIEESNGNLIKFLISSEELEDCVKDTSEIYTVTSIKNIKCTEFFEYDMEEEEDEIEMSIE